MKWVNFCHILMMSLKIVFFKKKIIIIIFKNSLKIDFSYFWREFPQKKNQPASKEKNPSWKCALNQQIIGIFRKTLRTFQKSFLKMDSHSRGSSKQSTLKWKKSKFCFTCDKHEIIDYFLCVHLPPHFFSSSQQQSHIHSTAPHHIVEWEKIKWIAYGRSSVTMMMSEWKIFKHINDN